MNLKNHKLRSIVYLGVITMNSYSTLTIYPEMKL